MNYGQFLEGLVLPLGDALTRQNVMERYRFYRESQWWERADLLKYQQMNLNETVIAAYRDVPLYRRLFDLHGVKAEAVRNREHLGLLPVVNKSVLKAAYPTDCVRASGLPWREAFTSGSSGAPFAVRVDNGTLSHARALMLLRASFSGWKIGDALLQTGMTLDRGLLKLAKDLVLRTRYVSAVDLTDQALDVALDYIERDRIKYVMGYPASLYHLAKRAASVGFSDSLDGAVTWGDNLYPHFRQTIQDVFHCRVTDTYGCGEGIQVASQCEEGSYHIFMPHVLVEISDDNGIPLQDGQSGNIVLTRLDPGAMPLIRYQVGDIGQLNRTKECKCGRGLEILDTIVGRDSDVVTTPRGNRLIVHFFTGIFEYYPSIESFLVVQDKSGAVLIEIAPEADFDVAILATIKDEIRKKGDPNLEVEMKVVSRHSRTFGAKRRFVVSEFRSS